MKRPKTRLPFNAAGYDEIFQGLYGRLLAGIDAYESPDKILADLQEDITAVAMHDRQAGLKTLQYKLFVTGEVPIALPKRKKTPCR